MTPAVNRSFGQRFLAVGRDRILQKVVSTVSQTYPQVEIITVQNYSTAFELIEQIQPQSTFVELESELTLDLLRIKTGLKLVERLLTNHWHPNIMVLCDDPNSLVCLQSAIKNYRGGFAAIEKSLPLWDLACYIDLVEWGAVYLPQVLKPYPQFQVKWLKLLHLRFEKGFNDRAIAAKLKVSDRTIRNYWSRIQDTLSITDKPDKDTKAVIGIEARKLGLID